MNGVHDMGGMDGFGKVEAEPNEPVFHAHGKAACWRCCAPWAPPAPGNIDIRASASETLPPHVYLVESYYKNWLLGLEDSCVDKRLCRRRGSRGRPRADARQAAASAASSRSPMSSAS